MRNVGIWLEELKKIMEICAETSPKSIQTVQLYAHKHKYNYVLILH